MALGHARLLVELGGKRMELAQAVSVDGNKIVAHTQQNARSTD
jgi:hypothetical protein